MSLLDDLHESICLYVGFFVDVTAVRPIFDMCANIKGRLLFGVLYLFYYSGVHVWRRDDGSNRETTEDLSLRK